MNDKFTYSSLVIVAAIFTIALSIYLADMQVALIYRILGVVIPAILVALFLLFVVKPAHHIDK